MDHSPRRSGANLRNGKSTLMPKIGDEPLEAIQVRLFKKDLDALRRLYKGSFGVNRAIRTVIHSFVTQTEARANQEIDKMEASEELLQ